MDLSSATIRSKKNVYIYIFFFCTTGHRRLEIRTRSRYDRVTRAGGRGLIKRPHTVPKLPKRTGVEGNEEATGDWTQVTIRDATRSPSLSPSFFLPLLLRFHRATEDDEASFDRCYSASSILRCEEIVTFVRRLRNKEPWRLQFGRFLSPLPLFCIKKYRSTFDSIPYYRVKR